MRVLFVCPGLPYPPRKGGAMRVWAFLRWLARRHDVSLLAFGDESAVEKPLRETCRRVVVSPTPTRSPAFRLLTTLISPKPDLYWRLRSRRFQMALDHLVATDRPDAVVFTSLEMAAYHRRSAPVVAALDEFNAEYLLQRRVARNDLQSPWRWPGAAYSAGQYLRLRRWESLVTRRFPLVFAVSAADAAALVAIGSPTPVVAPNGVDLAAYDCVVTSRQVRPPDQPKLLFIGTLDYRPNVDAMVWFVDAIWPLIRANRPDARVAIVGASPNAAVRRLAATPGVDVVGEVADVRPHLAAATAYVLPMRTGGGARLKLLEAFAAGVPVVTTAMGAEGVDTPPDCAVIADGAPEFAEAAVKLLANPDAACEMAARARQQVAVRYDWSNIAPIFERALLNAVWAKGPQHR